MWGGGGVVGVGAVGTVNRRRFVLSKPHLSFDRAYRSWIPVSSRFFQSLLSRLSSLAPCVAADCNSMFAIGVVCLDCCQPLWISVAGRWATFDRPACFA